MKKTVRVTKQDILSATEIKNEIVDRYKDEFDTLIAKKSTEFSLKLSDFANKMQTKIEEKDGKINTLPLENFFFRALAPVYGVEAKYSAPLIDLASEFFWNCIEQTYDKGIIFIPTIQLFAAMIGVSTSTITKYSQSSDIEMRDAIARLKDRFISFYTSRGLKREISEVMTIFTLKASYGMRDNEPQNVVYNDNKIIMSDNIREKLLKNVSQYKNVIIEASGDSV